MAKISVLGSGAWGTALAMLLSDNGHEVLLWSPFAEHTEELRRTRKSSALGGLELRGRTRLSLRPLRSIRAVSRESCAPM